MDRDEWTDDAPDLDCPRCGEALDASEGEVPGAICRACRASAALQDRANASYQDALRLDAFDSQDARQAFLEGYVRGAAS